MTTFDVRIPGLPMTVIGADGIDVHPVETDEFRIAVAETYDVIVEPRENRPYTVFAESMDRSGYARGTLAPREGLEAPVPELRPRPLRTMAAMGMVHGAMGGMDRPSDHGGGVAGDNKMEHSMRGMGPPGAKPQRHDMHDGGMGHMQEHPGGQAMQQQAVHRHPSGPGTVMEPEMVSSRLDDPGIGLGDDGWRVLTYSELRKLTPNADARAPGREVELHLTGNMERFMWSFDGVKFNEVDGPIPFAYGERLRLTLVNDSMMEHPIHLHGMFMELENGAAERPLKHTINVQPAAKVSLLVTADAPGNWALHCHLLYHMEAGMFRVVRVGPADAADAPADHAGHDHGNHGEQA